jgi:hypothetical protein
MRALTAIFALCGLLACGGGSEVAGPSPNASEPSKRPVMRVPEGAYHAANPWTGNHLGELPATFSLAHVMLDEHEVNMAQFFGGRQVIVGAHNWGFHPSKPLPWQPRKTEWLLRRDYEASYQRLERLLAPFRSQIWAVEIADEPTSRNTPLSHVQTAVEWWESRGYPTIVNQQLKFAAERPQNVSHYALTCYTQTDGCWDIDWDACEAASLAFDADVVLGLGFDNWGCGLKPSDLSNSRQLAQDIQASALIWFLWPDIGGLQGLGSTGLR